MQRYPTRDEVLADIKGKMGGRHACARLSRIFRVSSVGSAKWLREGIPRERVPVVAAITGVPPHIMRPDFFGPPVDSQSLQEGLRE